MEREIRTAATAWLDARLQDGRDVLSYEELASFQFDGTRVPLIDPQRGIRKPIGLAAALSIRTSYTRPGQTRPYDDAEGPDGLLRYKYRGDDPNHYENVALRRSYELQLPLIWFVATQPGAYLPIYPIWIVADEPSALQFVVAFDVGQRYTPVGVAVEDEERRYATQATHRRLHQRVFRVQVLEAYRTSCAMCRLRYRSLLDAAHILPDGHPRGNPVVQNGLSLCKIHHAAFDAGYLGVRPDYVVEVRGDIRDDTDGPMLLHGLQEMAGVRLALPRSTAARPDTTRLEERYEQFKLAG